MFSSEEKNGAEWVTSAFEAFETYTEKFFLDPLLKTLPLEFCKCFLQNVY